MMSHVASGMLRLVVIVTKREGITLSAMLLCPGTNNRFKANRLAIAFSDLWQFSIAFDFILIVSTALSAVWLTEKM